MFWVPSGRCGPLYVRCVCRTQLRYDREQQEGATNPSKKKKTRARKTAPPELEEESGDEEVVWTERGVEDYEASDHFKRRSKMSKDIGRGVSLSAEARKALPTLDKFILNQDPTSGEFSLGLVLEKCFDLNFPQEARELFADKVCFSFWCCLVAARHVTFVFPTLGLLLCACVCGDLN